LSLSDLPIDVKVKAVLVDDGSADGTALTVAREFPWVDVHRASGDLFWCRGMHLAHEMAMKDSPDFLLWLNDDTELHPGGLGRMLETYKTLSTELGANLLVVGSTVDNITQELTYGGLLQASKARRFRYKKIWHKEEARECQAMNGNLVLVPSHVARQLGNLDPIFEHAMGDIDYALRARKAGVRVFVAGGVMGYCSVNPIDDGHRDQALPFRTRWAAFKSRKGLPPRSWLHLVRRHAGLWWPFYYGYPYVRFALQAMTQKILRRH
jgi:GT2 family glycosyltransferase